MADKFSEIFEQEIFKENKKDGFMIPVAPGHSLSLLNDYMRTDLLRYVHKTLHQRLDNKGEDSPLKILADSLEEVINIYKNRDVVERIDRNPFHCNPALIFDAEKDYRHDIRLMKFHLEAHLKTLLELDEVY